jgi:hypothetical protein
MSNPPIQVDSVKTKNLCNSKIATLIQSGQTLLSAYFIGKRSKILTVMKAGIAGTFCYLKFIAVFISARENRPFSVFAA